MTSSRSGEATGLLVPVWLSAVLITVLGQPLRAEAQPSHVEAYNRATAIEREGLDSPEGGPGSVYLRRSQRDCLVAALGSYGFQPSRLAAWRIVSCAGGIENWLLTHLAAMAFKRLEPAGIEGWSHPSFDDEEVQRVRRAAAEASRHVGAVRLAVPEGAEVFWGDTGPPVDLNPSGGLPGFDADVDAGRFRQGPVKVGDAILVSAPSTLSMAVSVAGRTERIEVQVRPLSEAGVQVATMAPGRAHGSGVSRP